MCITPRPVSYFLSRRSPWSQRLHQWLSWFLRDVSLCPAYEPTCAGASPDSSAGSRQRAGHPPATTPRPVHGRPAPGAAPGAVPPARRVRPGPTPHATARPVVRCRRQGDEAASSALQIEHRVPIDEHDVGAGRALQRQPLVAVGPRPGERRAVRLGRIGGRQDTNRSFVVADGPEPVDGSGQCELRSPETGDEVAPPRSARLLHGAKDRVDRCVPADDPLGRRALPRDDSVALEQRRRDGVAALGGRSLLPDQVGHQRPPPRGSWRPERSQPSGPRRALRPRAWQREGPQRRERVVRRLARPDQVPQRVEQLVVGACLADRRAQLREERRTAPHEVLADGVVDRLRGAVLRRTGAGEQIDPVAAVERDAAVVAAERAAADPDDLAGRPELVEQARGVAGDPGAQDVALEDRRRDRDALELGDDLDQPAQRRPRPIQLPARRAGSGRRRPPRPARPRGAAGPAIDAGAGAGRRHR